MILVALAAIIVPALVRLFTVWLIAYVIFYSMLVGIGLSAALSGQIIVVGAVLLVLAWPHLMRGVENGMKRRARAHG